MQGLMKSKNDHCSTSYVEQKDIHTMAIIVAVEDEAEVLLAVHHPDEEDIMETMEANPRQGTIKCKMVPNQPAGTATFTDIVKRITANVSRRTLPAKASMDQPTGQNKKHRLLEKVKTIMILKEQLVKCTPEIWPQCFQIFNEGRS